jgi:acetyl-CoA carboxylase biotin carboxylase subunit
MDRALEEFRIGGRGVHTTRGFLRRVVADERFRAGTHDTSLVERLLAEESKPIL